MNPRLIARDARPGDVLLTAEALEADDPTTGEYRLMRPLEPDSDTATVYDMHAGARVVSVDLATIAEVVPRDRWDRDTDAGDELAEPEPPDVAAYVVDALERQDSDALRAIARYAEQRAAFLEARPVDDPSEHVDDGEQLVDAETTSSGTIIKKKVPCGKDCSGCPHGPYRYRVYREGDDVRHEYLGAAES